jgi:triosephosphate isomerase
LQRIKDQRIEGPPTVRKKLVAGNWKMHTTAASAKDLAVAIVRGIALQSGIDVALCPPYPYLALVGEVLRGSKVALGAQNLYPEKEGAFTGEVSPTMLLDVGCRYVILGHSERRHKLGESNDFVNHKVRVALNAGLQVILCLGETLAQREAEQTEAILWTQIESSFKDVPADQLANMVIAYEPVWAIGTGRNASAEQAQAAHAFIRAQIASLYGEESARALPIQYGGSAKPENVASLLQQPDVDGALVGGASLKADSFIAIVQAAQA